MSTTPDRRVRKTKSQLKDAMIFLMKEKSIAEISVREVTERADINRGTFYLHYKDVYDMVEQIEDEMINEFRDVFNTRIVIEQENRILLIFEDIFTYVVENATLCAVLLSPHGDISFQERLKIVIKEEFYRHWDALYNQEKSLYFDSFFTFLVAGCIGLIQKWLDSNMKKSPQEMAQIVHAIIIKGAAVLK